MVTGAGRQGLAGELVEETACLPSLFLPNPMLPEAVARVQIDALLEVPLKAERCGYLPSLIWPLVYQEVVGKYTVIQLE